MVSLKGQYELEDVKAAQDLHARSGVFMQWVAYVLIGVLALFVVTGVVFALMHKGTWTVVIYPAFILAFLGLYRYWLRPSTIARAYRQHKDLASPFEMELNDEGYSIQNEYGSGKTPWKDYIKWKADAKMILLYKSDNMFNMVPRRLLSEVGQAEYIFDQLAKNNVKEAAQKRNPARTVLWVVILALAVVLVALVLSSGMK